MSLLKSLFGKKEDPIRSYADFWDWFRKNEKVFFKVVREHKNIEKDFFRKLSPNLDKIKEGLFFVTGMYDDNTVELIITADGDTKNIVFAEELVNASPLLEGWKFTALKPSLNIKNVSIEMAGYKFNDENLSFYANDYSAYPDEVDIVIVHTDQTDDNKKRISTGTYIFLDNYLGELDFLNNIDNLSFSSKNEAQKELIPIDKLKDYLTWRQKEFIEKYDAILYDTENYNYSILEAKLENGYPLIALINTDLLAWDSKASHPWIAILTIKYDGRNNNGLPNEKDYIVLDNIENEINQELHIIEGYLNIGRQTSNGEREIYFACKDFRKPSKIYYLTQQKYKGHFVIEFILYKDKYWKTFEKYSV